jgi:hypothetical protein
VFHVLSGHNGELRERLYRMIGFEKCNEIELPAELAPLKITNPDAPRNDHRIRVRVGEESVWAVPILFSNSERYDPQRGGGVFDYLQFRLLLVEEVSGGTVKPMYEGAKPRLVEVSEVSGLFEQVGRNTRYVIHPEEILAENFALLMVGKTDVASPEVPEKMREVLIKAGRAESRARRAQ